MPSLQQVTLQVRSKATRSLHRHVHSQEESRVCRVLKGSEVCQVLQDPRVFRVNRDSLDPWDLRALRDLPASKVYEAHRVLKVLKASEVSKVRKVSRDLWVHLDLLDLPVPVDLPH